VKTEIYYAIYRKFLYNFVKKVIMNYPFDVNLFKKNPELFFSQLPKKAEDEIVDFLQFIVFKYNISIISENNRNNFESENRQEIAVNTDVLNAFASFRTGLPANYKFSREEANER